MFLVIIAPAVFILIIKVHELVVINTFVIFLCEIYPNVIIFKHIWHLTVLDLLHNLVIVWVQHFILVLQKDAPVHLKCLGLWSVVLWHKHMWKNLNATPRIMQISFWSSISENMCLKYMWDSVIMLLHLLANAIVLKIIWRFEILIWD